MSDKKDQLDARYRRQGSSGSDEFDCKVKVQKRNSQNHTNEPVNLLKTIESILLSRQLSENRVVRGFIPSGD